MSFILQLSACLYRHWVQFKRSPVSLIGLLLTPLICAIIIFFLRDDIKNSEFDVYGFMLMILVGNSPIGYMRGTLGVIVHERTEKLKELMLMNGLSSFASNVGDLIIALLKTAIMGLPFLVVFLLFGTVFQALGFYVIFSASALVYGPLAMALSTLFSRAPSSPFRSDRCFSFSNHLRFCSDRTTKTRLVFRSWLVYSHQLQWLYYQPTSFKPTRLFQTTLLELHLECCCSMPCSTISCSCTLMQWSRRKEKFKGLASFAFPVQEGEELKKFKPPTTKRKELSQTWDWKNH